MRELKFRAWNGKRMAEVVYIDFAYQVVRLNGGIACKLATTPVMQYTCLKDKNGKEIYEGDYVAEDETVMSDAGEDKSDYIEKRIDSHFKYGDGKVGERRYGRKVHVVEWKETSCGFEPFSDSRDNCGHCGGGRSALKLTIIGNIYENPDLLTS